MKLEDAELIRQTLTGNKDAFSELVRRYSGLICGLAYHFVGNMSDAEDLAQEAFIRAYQNLAQLKNPSKFGQWLRQITANLCRNWKTRYSNDAKGIQLFDPVPGSRDIRQFAQVASQQPLPDEIVEKKELQEAVRVAIDSLSENNRLTVILFYMHDLSHQDVSHFLGIPVSAVKARLHKARKQLKERLLIMMENEFEKIKPKEEFTKRVMLTIGGRVVSADAGSPIADAKVILDYQTHTFTDTSGNYRIEVESGKTTERRLWIRAKGYPTYFQDFCTNREQTQVVLDAALDTEVVASISGRLVAEDGKPVEGVEFWLSGGEYSGGRLPDWPVTDENGYFRYDGLRPSRRPYHLDTSKSDYLWKELEFIIDRPGHLNLGEIVLKKGKTISGRVTNAQGEPAADAYVHAGPSQSVGHTRDAKAQTDDNGKYTLRNVDWEVGGIAYVMVFAKWYGMASRRVEFGESQTLDGVDFQLEKGTQISGIVTDEQGKPLKGRKVEVLTLASQDNKIMHCHIGGDYLVSETDAEGRFCIEGLPQGDMEIKIRFHNPAYNYYYPVLDASQRPIKIGMTDLHLVESKPPDAQIAGTVVDTGTGQPIPKFHIRRGYPKANTLEEIKEEKIYWAIPPKSVDFHNAWARWNHLRVMTYFSSDGKFTIENLSPDSKVCLLFTAEGYVATEAGPFLPMPKPDASELTIKMQRGKTIRGIITDSESGQPIYGGIVTYFSPTQPYTHEGQILPYRIPIEGVREHRLPLGGETVCTKKNGEYEITTAQTEGNYLLVTYPGYSFAIIGPISITEAVIDLPIALTKP
ncbi:sigma-70 family RNA polymerase sigma factor [Candidatus Poribacteria bacterium]|nr:sigma-70 family RNA polymerase sigma factor [Candidatus Poribacteria bacterium]